MDNNVDDDDDDDDDDESMNSCWVFHLFLSSFRFPGQKNLAFVGFSGAHHQDAGQSQGVPFAGDFGLRVPGCLIHSHIYI